MRGLTSTLVLVVVLGVITFLLMYLVPQVVGLLKTMAIALPIQISPTFNFNFVEPLFPFSSVAVASNSCSPI